MDVHIDPNGAPRLVDAEALTSLRLTGTAPSPDARAALASAGIVITDDDGHGYVEPATFARLAGPTRRRPDVASGVREDGGVRDGQGMDRRRGTDPGPRRVGRVTTADDGRRARWLAGASRPDRAAVHRQDGGPGRGQPGMSRDPCTTISATAVMPSWLRRA